MIQFLVAAPCSGSGKTTLTCALLAALKRRGQDLCSFKSGPDYIDPMFHRAVLGVESHNLDLFFSAPETVRALYAQAAAGHGAAVCEGAMGFYDGLGGVSDTASAWHLADTLGLPVLLVVQPRGASLTLAAQINGLKQFRTPSHLAGILLNDCAPHLYALLAPMLERETGLPVLGYLPHLPDAALESRHLGLKTAGEIADLQQKISSVAETTDTLLEKILAEGIYNAGDEVAVMVNGLGATPLQELYLANLRVSEVLAEKNIKVAKTLVGNYMTSIDMAGYSITLLKLDAELKELVNAPADTPAFVQV